MVRKQLQWYAADGGGGGGGSDGGGGGGGSDGGGGGGGGGWVYTVCVLAIQVATRPCNRSAVPPNP